MIGLVLNDLAAAGLAALLFELHGREQASPRCAAAAFRPVKDTAVDASAAVCATRKRHMCVRAGRVELVMARLGWRAGGGAALARGVARLDRLGRPVPERVCRQWRRQWVIFFCCDGDSTRAGESRDNVDTSPRETGGLPTPCGAGPRTRVQRTAARRGFRLGFARFLSGF